MTIVTETLEGALMLINELTTTFHYQLKFNCLAHLWMSHNEDSLVACNVYEEWTDCPHVRLRCIPNMTDKGQCSLLIIIMQLKGLMSRHEMTCNFQLLLLDDWQAGTDDPCTCLADMTFRRSDI